MVQPDLSEVFEIPAAGCELPVDAQVRGGFRFVDDHGMFHSRPEWVLLPDVYNTIPI